MFIELELDEGPVVLNANNIVKIYIGDPVRLILPRKKYNYTQRIHILTIDGSIHSKTFENEDYDVVTDCSDFFGEINSVLEPVKIYD